MMRMHAQVLQVAVFVHVVLRIAYITLEASARLPPVNVHSTAALNLPTLCISALSGCTPC